MAEQVVAFVVEKIGELLINEARFMSRVPVQLEELQAEMRRMCGFLKDVDGRQEQSKTLQDLVIDIRKVTYDAEDVLELYAFKVSSRRRRRNVLLRFACIFNEGIALYRVGSKIDSIKIKFSKLTTSLRDFGITAVREGGEGPSSSHERLNQVRRIYSHFIEEDFVGFDEDIRTLVGELVNQDTDRRVVSIFGMGGLGKTTLAMKVYHHPDVRRHFDSFASVCISQKWEKMDVLKGILIKLSPEREEEIKKMREDKLARELFEIQQQKKCLVVLDDIWHNDVWNALQQAFPYGYTGSRILLTSRMKEVACHIDPNAFLHQLRFLNTEESWRLLVKKAFPGRRDTEPRVETQMEKKGREMLQPCGGVPLAIVVLGGQLANRHTLNEWERVHYNLSRYLMGGGIDKRDQRIKQVLTLSYDDLPCQLKSCFLYMGNLQKNFNVSIEKLCLLWIAEGVVDPKEKVEGEIMMDVAVRYLGELAQRSMIQIKLPNEECLSKTCHLHDLMRELCLSKRKGEDFQSLENVHDSSSSSMGITRTRKLAIYFGLQIDLPNLKEFKLLRVLDFEEFDFGEKRIPEGIGKLIHLKYLSFKHCYWDVRKLPSSIGNLQFLQILDIRALDLFGEGVSVPNVLWKLESLRHLYLPYYMEDINEKLTLDGLRRLEILENFDTRTCVSKDLFKLPELRNLKATVRAECMRNMETVRVGCMEDMETIINYLNATSHQLRSTYLHFILASQEEEPFLVSRKVLTIPSLERLELEGKIGKLPEYRHDHFSASLTRIELNESGLTEDPMTTLEKLPNLKSLFLGRESYVGNEMVCSAGGFPQLRHLELWWLLKLENWRVDEGALPVLPFLFILGCNEMKRLPEGLKFVTKLQKLVIYLMPKVFGDKVRGEDSYIIQHVPSVIITEER
ncbi:hypothetical protein LguiB_026472 [Lonicera macranthoides]